jgi:hypothetical protein
MMKKVMIISLAVLFPLLLTAQETESNRLKHIRGGLYLKAGPVIPVGAYSQAQHVPFIPAKNPLPYLPAQLGAALDLGFIFYLGPSFANNLMRAGIDATFLSTWFNYASAPNSKSISYYYTYAGQKFGPVITINPVNRLMIDLSYKLNANISYHDESDAGWQPLPENATSTWGYSLFSNEVSMGIRYSILVLSFQYNFGTMNYNDFDSSNPDQEINNDTFRILFGFKF